MHGRVNIIADLVVVAGPNPLLHPVATVALLGGGGGGRYLHVKLLVARQLPRIEYERKPV